MTQQQQEEEEDDEEGNAEFKRVRNRANEGTGLVLQGMLPHPIADLHKNCSIVAMIDACATDAMTQQSLFSCFRSASTQPLNPPHPKLSILLNSRLYLIFFLPQPPLVAAAAVVVILHPHLLLLLRPTCPLLQVRTSEWVTALEHACKLCWRSLEVDNLSEETIPHGNLPPQSILPCSGWNRTRHQRNQLRIHVERAISTAPSLSFSISMESIHP